MTNPFICPSWKFWSGWWQWLANVHWWLSCLLGCSVPLLCCRFVLIPVYPSTCLSTEPLIPDLPVLFLTGPWHMATHWPLPDLIYTYFHLRPLHHLHKLVDQVRCLVRDAPSCRQSVRHIYCLCPMNHLRVMRTSCLFTPKHFRLYFLRTRTFRT